MPIVAAFLKKTVSDDGLFTIHIIRYKLYERQNQITTDARCTDGGRALRNAGKLKSVAHGTEHAMRNPRVTRPRFYERLPANLKSISNKEMFSS